MLNKPDVIFLGFDEGALSALLKCNVNILAVIYEETQEKNYSGKFNSEIIKNGGEICTFPKNNRTELLALLNRMKKPDLFIISCFIILNEDIMRIPENGIINIHPSLLPDYKGPYPLEWALLNGEEKTGVTFMTIDSGVDTGGIYRQYEVVIEDVDNVLTLKQKINKIVEHNLEKIIKGVLAGTITPVAQSSGGSYFPRRTYFGRFANFKLMGARDVHNLVRSQFEHGGMITTYNFQRIAFLSSVLIDDSSAKTMEGEILKITANEKEGCFVTVQCLKGKVELYSKDEAAKLLKVGDRLGT